MTRWISLLLTTALLSGCGTYRITYRFPSNEVRAEKFQARKTHHHGIGLIGGGGYFFFVHQMFPALVDYTGEQEVAAVCPYGVYEVEHHTNFGQNTLAALISWLVVVNAWQMSEVNWTCVKEPIGSLEGAAVETDASRPESGGSMSEAEASSPVAEP